MIKEFKIEIQSIDWKMLTPHAQRGDLILVAPELDLLEVGQAMATDENQKVKGWMDQGQLRRPTPDQISLWQKIDDEIFDFVIVQPFVFAKINRH